MFVAAAAAVSVGGTIYGMVNSNKASRNSSQAITQAADTQAAATNRAIDLEREKFDYGKSLQEPFYRSSIPAYFDYVDAITGERQNYYDPNYEKVPYDELYNENLIALQNLRDQNDPIFARHTDNNLVTYLDQKKADPRLPYNLRETYYRGPDNKITTNLPPILQSKQFNPTESPAYNWQQQQMEKNTGRTLRSLGRENSTYGMNVMGEQNRNLAASEYDKQLGRLADLTNIARGGVSSLTGSARDFANSAGNKIINNSNNQANAILGQADIANQRLYNNQDSLMSLANTGLKAFSLFG